MKKLATTATAIILIVFLIMGCEKDYRDKYTGEWDFMTEKYIYGHKYVDGVTELVLLKDDTVYYSGKITLGNAEDACGNAEFIIQYTPNDEVVVYVSKSGGINVPIDLCAKGCTRGNFKGKDKMNLSFRWGGEYPDGVETHKIVGTKKKGDKQ